MDTQTIVNNHRFLIFTILSALSGTIACVHLRLTHNLTFIPRISLYINFLGKLYESLLHAIRAPVLLTTIIPSLGTLPVMASSKIAQVLIFYVLLTSFCGNFLGLLLTVLIRPGVDYVDTYQLETPHINLMYNITTADIFLDSLGNVFPVNLIQAWESHYQTILVLSPNNTHDNITSIDYYVVQRKFVDGKNILGICVMSILCGISLTLGAVNLAALLKFCKELARIFFKMFNWINFAMLEIEHTNAVLNMFWLCLTVVLTCFIHTFLILPGFYYYITRKNPYKIIFNMLESLCSASTICSSSATVPFTIKNLEYYTDIGKRVIRLVIPVCTTVNNDGSALYKGIAVVFIAQQVGIPLTLGNYLSIGLLTIGLSINTTFEVGRSFRLLIGVTTPVNISAHHLVLLGLCDWFLTRIRAMTNLMSDIFAVHLVWHYCKLDIEKQDQFISKLV